MGSYSVNNTVTLLQEADFSLRELSKETRGSSAGRKKARRRSSPSEHLTGCNNVCTYIHCIMHVFRARNVLSVVHGAPRGRPSSVGDGVSNALSDTVWDVGCLRRSSVSRGSGSLHRKQASLQQKVQQSQARYDGDVNI